MHLYILPQRVISHSLILSHLLSSFAPSSVSICFNVLQLCASQIMCDLMSVGHAMTRPQLCVFVCAKLGECRT